MCPLAVALNGFSCLWQFGQYKIRLADMALHDGYMDLLEARSRFAREKNLQAVRSRGMLQAP